MIEVLWGATVAEPPIHVKGSFDTVPGGYSQLKQYEADWGYGKRLGNVFRRETAPPSAPPVKEAIRDFDENYKMGKAPEKPITKAEMADALDVTNAPAVERATPAKKGGTPPSPGTPPGSPPDTPAKRGGKPDTDTPSAKNTTDPGGSAKSRSAVEEGLGAARKGTPLMTKLSRAVFGAPGTDTPSPAVPAPKPSPGLPPNLNYNQFQTITAGRYPSNAEKSTAWQAYKASRR